MDSLLLVLHFLSDPYNLMIIAGGTFVGLIVGALPGLDSVILIALMLPFVVRMDPTTGIALCSVVCCATTYGAFVRNEIDIIGPAVQEARR